jgi:hypothetical protein
VSRVRSLIFAEYGCVREYISIDSVLKSGYIQI